MKTPKLIYPFIADLVLRNEDIQEVLKKVVTISKSKIIENYRESNEILTNIYALIDDSETDEEKKTYAEILNSRFEIRAFLDHPLFQREVRDYRSQIDVQLDVVRNVCKEIENEEYEFSWFSLNLRNRNFYIREIASLKKAYEDRLFEFYMSCIIAPIICSLIFAFFFIVESWYGIFPILALLWGIWSYFKGRRKKQLSTYHVRILGEEAFDLIPLHYDTIIGQEQMKVLMKIITDNIKRQSERSSKPMQNKVNKTVEDLLCSSSYTVSDLKLCFDFLKVDID